MDAGALGRVKPAAGALTGLAAEPLGTPVMWVVCLCADWCGLCRDYRAVLKQVAAQYPAHRFVWLDIEDQADMVGDMDIETFPTLLVADAKGVLFLGPLAPHAATLSRVLASFQCRDVKKIVHSDVTKNLLATLPLLPELWL